MRIWITSLIAALIIVGLYFLQKTIYQKTVKQDAIYEKEILHATQHYAINKPDQTLKLPGELQEISGLSYSDIYGLLANQDEKGSWYQINTQDGKILHQEKISGAGDFEGIEAVGQKIYLITSEGKLWSYNHLQEVTEDDLKLDGFDIEGLGYSIHLQSLLISAKAKGDLKSGGHRAIFRYSLKGIPWKDKPYMVIDSPKWNKEMKNKGVFEPSGLTVDRNGQILLISATAQSAAVLDTLGQLISHVSLNPVIHAQPEGITIDDAGNLYIANESRQGVAKIHIFHPLKH